jgi:hypothetical protein
VVDLRTFVALTALAGAGVVAGLVLLVRGMIDYRSLLRVADTSTSMIDSVAAGEVRISGTIEPAEMTLVSLLQSVPCVFYRATVSGGRDRIRPKAGYTEERSIGFRVRDTSGTVRVFPRGARFDAPVRFAGETDSDGDDPPGLNVRRTGSTVAYPEDRALAADALLHVHDPEHDDWPLPSEILEQGGSRSYNETRLEPGDPVTIVGRAAPFSDLPDPTSADTGTGSDPLLDDPEIAADLAAARASGSLADDPATAWGNAAIAGFGIGRPVSAPVIDPAAHRLTIAGPEEAARTEEIFAIAPETLILAASAEVPLLIAFGTPGQVGGRNQTRFLIGLLGAILAIASAMVLAIVVNGRISG